MPLWDQLVKDWPTLQGAWMSVGGLIILALAAGWGVGRFMFGQQIANANSETKNVRSLADALEGRLKLRDDQLSDLQRKLESAPPDQTNALVADLSKQIKALQPYGLSTEQADAMLRVLERRQAGIFITQDVAAPDSMHLYDQVCGLFEQAGWPLTSRKGIIGIDDPPDCGVTLIRRPGSSDEVMGTIREALNVANLDFVERDLSRALSEFSVPQLSFSSRDRNYVPKARWS